MPSDIQRELADVQKYGWPAGMPMEARREVLSVVSFFSERLYPPHGASPMPFKVGAEVYAIDTPTRTPAGCVSMGTGIVLDHKNRIVSDIWYLPGVPTGERFLTLRGVPGMFRATSFGRAFT